MQCGAPAAPSRRPEKIPGRNRIGLVALNGLVPGGVPPSPQPLTRWVKKIEAVEGIVPVRRNLVGRCAAIGMMQQRIADLPIFVFDCCESHLQKQAQFKVGAFAPQSSVYQN
jgi:hypothetical protein